MPRDCTGRERHTTDTLSTRGLAAAVGGSLGDFGGHYVGCVLVAGMGGGSSW